MKKYFRRTIAIVLTALMIAAIPVTGPLRSEAYASSGGTCQIMDSLLEKDNIGDNDYSRWTKPVYSYLIKEGSQYMSVQAEENSDKIQITYYDSTYTAVSRKTVSLALPIFGGFYSYNGYYYVVSGQNNTAKDNTAEVFRITKYNKNWGFERSIAVKGTNTVYPFKAGSCRMVGDGNYLIIRTCHEMYSGHQSNLTITIEIASSGNLSVKELSTNYQYQNSKYGYVSHSFNQFVRTDSHKLIALDHGDANDTRSAALFVYPNNISTSGTTGGSTAKLSPITAFAFSGSSGDNTTGASLGGLEVGSSSYIIAGNSVNQSYFDTYKTRNIFTASVNKSTKAVTKTWITNEAEGGETCSTPQLVKIGSDSFLLIWYKYYKELYYTKLDGNGKPTGGIKEGYGYLSDCAPIYDNGKVIWYTYNGTEETFYEINTSDMSFNYYERAYEHNYSIKSQDGDLSTIKCDDCGHEMQVLAPLNAVVKWSYDGSSYNVSDPVVFQGEKLYYNLYAGSFPSGYEDLPGKYYGYDCVIEALDKVNSHVDRKASIITFDKQGTYQFYIYPKFAPERKTTVQVKVTKPLSSVTLTTDKTTYNYGEKAVLTAVADGGKDVSFDFYRVMETYDSQLNSSYNEPVDGVLEVDVYGEGEVKYKVVARDYKDNNKIVESSIVTVNVIPQSSQEDSGDESSGSGDDYIEKTSIQYATASKIKDRAWTGKRIKPTPTVKYQGRKLSKGTDYTLSYKSNLNVGKAYVVIKGKGEFEDSFMVTFNIIPKSPNIRAPKALKKGITVKWKSLTSKMSKKRVEGYEAQACVSKKFNKKIYYGYAGGYKSTSCKINFLKAKKTYYVRVRSYRYINGKYYYSKWSKIKAVKTK